MCLGIASMYPEANRALILLGIFVYHPLLRWGWLIQGKWGAACLIGISPGLFLSRTRKQWCLSLLASSSWAAVCSALAGSVSSGGGRKAKAKFENFGRFKMGGWD